MKGQPSREKAVDQGSLKWSRRKRSRLYHSKTTRSTVVGKLTATTLPHSGLNAVGITTGDVFTQQSADTPPSHHSTSYDVVGHNDDEMTDTVSGDVTFRTRFSSDNFVTFRRRSITVVCL